MTSRPFIALAALALIACSPATGEAEQTAADAAPPDATAPAQDAAFSPADLTALIEARGAEDALMDLMAAPEDPRWQQLLASVSAATPGWIEAAAPLVPVLDGEAAESLFAAFGDALVHQPAAVLRAVGPDGMASACQPYPPEMTDAKMAALSRISDDDEVVVLRDECLTLLSGEPT